MTLFLAGYIIIIQFCYEVYFSKTPRLYEEYRQHILSGLEQSNSLPPFKDSYSYLRRNIDFESVYDSIKDDKDFPRKLKAIKTLGKIKNPDSIKALRVMLSDPHMDIRYYAGEEVASINEQYNIFINELKKELTRKPTDTQTYLETSNLLIDYAFSGFFELEEIKEKLEEARITLKRVLELDPALFEAHFLLGYIYLFNKEYGKAIDCYKKVLDIKNTFSLKGNDLSTLLGLTECYWQKKNLKEVDIYIKKIEEILIDYKGKDKELIINFIDTWSEVNV